MFWLQRTHVDFNELWEQVDFRLLAAFDVVANGGWRIEYATQPMWELWLMREGRCLLECGQERALLVAGDCALVAAGQRRVSSEIDGRPLSIIGLSLTATVYSTVDALALLHLPLRVEGISTQLQPLLEQIVAESRARPVAYVLAANGLAQQALALVVRAAAPEPSTDLAQALNEQLHPDIVRAIQFVADHYDQQLDVRMIAASVPLSPKHFSRKFKAALGMTPMDYLRRYRLRRAQALLRAGDSSVARIAEACGFPDAAYFSRAFKEQYGSAPIEFRRHLRSMAAPQASEIL